MAKRKWSHQPFEYSQITPQIFIGTNSCCETHFVAKLLRRGVRADISLEAERLDAPFGVTSFLWLPTKDHRAPAMAALRVGAHAIRELVDEGEKIFVHCRKGHGRAPTLVAAYFILMGDAPKAALERIRKARPSMHLRPAQLRRLAEFARWAATHKRNHD
jgi:hypothetical protein